jgi:hypothetical protein
LRYSDISGPVVKDFITKFGELIMEWAMQRTVERQANLMHAMMKYLNIDAVALVRQRNGEVYAEARTRCLVCQRSAECLEWMDGQSDGAPDFCPLVQFFDAYQSVICDN